MAQLFEDGVYLELICFTHPPSHYPPGSPERQERDTHRWASKSLGWIDFAFLGNGSFDPPRISDVINERAKQDGSGAKYISEQAGGRKRSDGRELKWVISAPEGEKGGTLPFFCGDVTPREWRVCRILWTLIRLSCLLGRLFGLGSGRPSIKHSAPINSARNCAYPRTDQFADINIRLTTTHVCHRGFPCSHHRYRGHLDSGHCIWAKRWSKTHFGFSKGWRGSQLCWKRRNGNL